MSSTQIERTRLLHQSIEANLEKLANELVADVKTTKDRVLADHKVAARVEKLVNDGAAVLEAYEDPDGLRKAELEDISGENVFRVFYDKLESLRQYHRKYGQAIAEILAPTEEHGGGGGGEGGSSEPVEADTMIKVKFSGAEGSGKYLDLQSLHQTYINISEFGQRMDYLQYLSKFDKFQTVPKDKKIKFRGKYKGYLEQLLEYVVSFFRRSQPLVNLQQVLAIIEQDFAKRWEEKKNLPGWFDAPSEESKEAAEPGAPVPEAAAAAAAEAKSTESEDPLYCKACQKSFAKQSVFDAHLPGKKHKKAVEMQSGAAASTSTPDQLTASLTAIRQQHERELALLELKISALADLLREAINDTAKYVELKQTRTMAELEADQLEAEADTAADESDDDNEPIYNPLNLPLGWDGKPIPYWLYKLHGLNIEYKCEICGGYTYRGPRAFERHFKDWRHAYGMKCLGIPNSHHFMFITRFEDAISLHQKLLKEAEKHVFKPEDEEEFEDEEGNVYNRKMYEDLKRQGLIR